MKGTHSLAFCVALRLVGSALSYVLQVCRSATQRAIDKAYVLQRQRLDRKIADMPEEVVAGWDTKSAWRVWELFPPIYSCPSKEKVSRREGVSGSCRRLFPIPRNRPCLHPYSPTELLFVQLGNQPEDGGKFVCGVDSLLQSPECVVLSFGSNVRPLLRCNLAVQGSGTRELPHPADRPTQSQATTQHEQAGV